MLEYLYMKKIILIVASTLSGTFLLIVLAGMYKFNYLASLDGYNVDGNKIEDTQWEKSIEVLGKDLEEFSVDKVVDGDTVNIKSKNNKIFTVRVIGIDTPETVHPTKKVECFGREASLEAKRILKEGEKVFLKTDDTQGKVDKYGRKLGYIILKNGSDFGKMMILGGFGYEYTYNTPYQKQAEYKEAQRWAEKSKKGLWAENICSSFEEIREQKETWSLKKDCNIKGNISFSKEKIYHIPGQMYYSKTKINELYGEKFFCSESEAVKEGWRKAKV
jgi:micrococcal nuclease